MDEYKKKLIQGSTPKIKTAAPAVQEPPKSAPGPQTGSIHLIQEIESETDQLRAPRRPQENSAKGVPDLIQERLLDYRSEIETEFGIKWSQLKADTHAQANLFFRILLGMMITGWVIFFALANWGILKGNDPESDSLAVRSPAIAKALQTEIEKKLDSPAVLEELNRQVKAAIEKSVAGIVTKKMADQIETFSSEMRSHLDRINLEVKTSLDQLNEVRSFVLTVERAFRDDRKSFEELLLAARSRNHPFQSTAKKMVQEIFDEITQEPSVVNAAQTADLGRGIHSLDDFKQQYSTASASLHSVLLQVLAGHPGISQKEKIDFFIQVIRSDRSLRAVHRAIKLVDADAKLGKPFTAYEYYLDWWAQNKAVRKDNL